MDSGQFSSEMENNTVGLENIIILEGFDMEHHVKSDRYAEETDVSKLSSFRKTIFKSRARFCS